ncbi:MAG: dTDP-4-dehydrorhamnose 3,5-epimerase [Aridibacter famidurans]|nr:dTDP-4-dehydrorhamnose 3,5-epimerase [Aridibacter famidurans]
MQITPLKLPGTFEIRPVIHGDARGYFSETYLKTAFEDAGLVTDWVQDNRAMSSRLYTLRGFHFQRGEFAQTKLVSASVGRILDVIIDIREGSETFGRWDSLELDAGECNSIYVPKGFAHAYLTLTETAIVQYKVDAPYAPDSEGGIRWNDPGLAVDWPTDSPILSDRDRELPFLRDLGGG